MFTNYLKTAWRNLIKYPVYSLVNLLGMALGLAASFVLLVYAYQELTYDRSFANADRIYRIGTDFYNMGGFAKSQEKLLDVMAVEAPEVEAATRFDRGFEDVEVRVGNQVYTEFARLYVDTAFFGFFSFDFIAGNSREALRSPDEIVLSSRLAEKYFGGAAAAMGRSVELGTEKKAYRVSGVVDNSNVRTHLEANFWLPLEKNPEPDQGWTNISLYQYVRLSENSTLADLERSMEVILRDYAHPAFKTDLAYEDWIRSKDAVKFFIQPLTDIYLHSNYNFEVSTGGSAIQVYILGIIGLFIILLAAINYVNLTTARSTVRAKEIAVKKTLGAARPQLIRQFLVESVGFALLALVLAGGLTELLLMLFEKITGEQQLQSLFANWKFPVLLLVFSLLIGTLAGVYPAFYLTAFRPGKIIKGGPARKENGQLRSSLVVFQFVISVGLIIGSMVVYQQLQYMLEKDKGFDQEGILVIENVSELKEQSLAFKQEVEREGQVLAASFAKRVPAGSGVWMYTYQTPAMNESITIQTFPIDADFIPTIGMRLAAGRNFSADIASDSSGVILNQAAVKALELGEDPIGAEVNERQRVVGVVYDFHFQTFKEKIAPAVLTYAPVGNRLLLKTTGSQASALLASITRIWNRLSPNEPIRYTFMDESFAKMAEKEQMLSRAITLFTVLALVIAILGLFGLATFSTEQRTKEIGIRKILGASVGDIVGLLSKDFLRLVAIAVLIASGIAWYGMSRWLENFAYHIDMSWWVFALSGLAAIVVAFLTVSIQSLKAAFSNPVESLRSE